MLVMLVMLAMLRAGNAHDAGADIGYVVCWECG